MKKKKKADTDQLLTLLLAPLFHTTPGPGGELSTTNRSDDVVEVRSAPLVALQRGHNDHKFDNSIQVLLYSHLWKERGDRQS